MGLKIKGVLPAVFPRPDALAYTSAAAVLVSPRLHGPIPPSKIYEQLASGKPLVATRIWSHTQVLDDRVCYLVDPAPESLADGLLAALQDLGRNTERAENARALYEREYARPVYESKIQAIAGDRRLMCGIAGIIAWRGSTPTRDDLVRMCDASSIVVQTTLAI